MKGRTETKLKLYDHTNELSGKGNITGTENRSEIARDWRWKTELILQEMKGNYRGWMCYIS